MNYALLLNRAFNIVWQHKFLIFLGALVALGSGSPGNQSSWRMDGNGNGNREFDFSTLPSMDGEIFRRVAIPLIAIAAVILFMFVLTVWVISLIARGGLIAGVDAIETGGTASFALAWRRGWTTAGPLVGIGLVPAIPLLVMLVTGLLGAGIFMGLFSALDSNREVPAAAGIGAIVLLVVCLAAPLAFGLSLLRIFAERACMLEGLGVFDAYRRGWEVATANLGAAVLLFVIQTVLMIGLGIALFVPGIMLLLCFLLWPVLLLIQGTIAAYFSTLWTLAWREWTGVDTVGSMISKAAPAL